MNDLLYELMTRERARQYQREARADRLARQAGVVPGPMRARARRGDGPGGDVPIAPDPMRRALVAVLAGVVAAGAFRKSR